MGIATDRKMTIATTWFVVVFVTLLTAFMLAGCVVPESMMQRTVGELTGALYGERSPQSDPHIPAKRAANDARAAMAKAWQCLGPEYSAIAIEAYNEGYTDASGTRHTQLFGVPLALEAAGASPEQISLAITALEGEEEARGVDSFISEHEVVQDTISRLMEIRHAAAELRSAAEQIQTAVNNYVDEFGTQERLPSAAAIRQAISAAQQQPMPDADQVVRDFTADERVTEWVALLRSMKNVLTQMIFKAQTLIQAGNALDTEFAKTLDGWNSVAVDYGSMDADPPPVVDRIDERLGELRWALGQKWNHIWDAGIAADQAAKATMAATAAACPDLMKEPPVGVEVLQVIPIRGTNPFNQGSLAAAGGTGSGTLSDPKLTVIWAGGGEGEVTSNPPGINCTQIGGSACQFTFSAGQSVNLIPSPDPGSVFSRWGTGDCDQDSGPTGCIVEMNSDRSVRVFIE